MDDQHEQLVKNDVLQYDALLSLYPWLTANGTKYAEIVSKNPFSMVIRGAKTIEYAIDENNIFGSSS